MLILIDKRTPYSIKHKLSSLGEVIDFYIPNNGYDSIKGHPDIFICSINKKLIISPSIENKYIELFNSKKINYTFGNQLIKNQYPYTCHYNATITNKYVIHNLKYTDKTIIDNTINHKHINVSQGYSRCNIISIDDDNFITSDYGIHKTLLKNNLNSLYLNPEKIILPSQKNGFIGGTTGICGRTIYFTGSLRHYPWGNMLKSFITNLNYEIKELCDDYLIDIGTILFVPIIS